MAGDERMVVDDRFRALEQGVQQLDDVSLGRLGRHIDECRPIALEAVHFDAVTQTWCPLAVGLDGPRIALVEFGIDTVATPLSEGKAKDLIVSVGRQTISGFNLNPILGVEGDFYTSDHRYDDLSQLAEHVIASRAAPVE
jgi:hypothetical protein